MEYVLQQHLSEPVDMAGNSESSSSSEDSDVLMIDPFLDYINKILMEEGMDDATCMPQVDDASYQSIFSGFYDIVAEHLPPNSFINSHVQHQSMHCYHEKGLGQQHVNDGFYSMTNEPRISLPANGHPQSSFQQQRAEVGFTPKHDFGFQDHAMASHTPLNSTLITGRLHGMKNDMFNSGAHLNSTGLNATSVSLSSTIDTMAQISIDLNNGVLMDGMVRCWCTDVVVDLSSMGGLEQI